MAKDDASICRRAASRLSEAGKRHEGVVSMTGIGRNTIYAAIAKGELKAKRIGSKKFVVSVDEVKRWLAE